MLPIERQQQILAWLEEEGTLKVSDISERLKVSEMTIYRDIKQLVSENKAAKTTNGVALFQKEKSFSSNQCAYCFKEGKSRLSMQIIMHDHSVEHACCPHCGLLMFSERRDEISQLICHDFLYDTTISAKMATFLLQPDIQIHCCEPQVIAFQSTKHAKQFQKGFGGEICDLEKAIHIIKSEMQGETCKH
ncbi:DeoR family transcriptional regulator, copper-sensing transcriptional repressor [Cytobacillus horneckiae]|uniref:DeoR/GlpR transcriptional regulator n=1 Tax=Cytobacillus horneckiae TaxID=549687 RepID=A0A2N0ZL96_9BACI|nr:DeoR family transcriptional regulator [Cytobacillus horneckiae]NRG48150.1 DeoR/GlpR transcriptional regulator [Bacillus sp. CRN 9]MBN6885700.1 DeoR/GlpR transcriptional regulator [Cytobacillus horneckiae]MCM3177249.1 DeoR family transcriptional regulator [Cytobacillus horneckiae]MEC1156190.1 DeoR family transcriptional regulator [Cytobacillus horneckiae]MED2938208.1 DeoR family transcriptional regulator [Cytobacillus horneckiae]